jgi:phosphoglycolate phosphatase
MNAHNYVMKKYGYNERNLSDIRKLAGKGSKAMLARSINEVAELSGKIKKTDSNIEKMTKEFINFYSKNIDKHSKPIKGIISFLEWSKSNNISSAVCTNKQESLAVDLLKKIKLFDYFEYVAGCDTFEFNKPDPRHLTNVVEIIGGDLKKTIMIGDSEVDANSADNAKLPFVLVEDGYTQKKANEIKHDVSIKDFEGFDKIIEEYL